MVNRYEMGVTTEPATSPQSLSFFVNVNERIIILLRNGTEDEMQIEPPHQIFAFSVHLYGVDGIKLFHENSCEKLLFIETFVKVHIRNSTKSCVKL